MGVDREGARGLLTEHKLHQISGIYGTDGLTQARWPNGPLSLS